MKVGVRVAEALMLDASRSDRQIAKELGVSNGTVSRHRKRLEKEGNLLPRVKSTHDSLACLYEVCTSAISPSPENDKLYDPVRSNDLAFRGLVRDVRQNGILVPLVVSADGYILSGHRRHAAAIQAGVAKVPVQIRGDIDRTGDVDAFVRALASYNRQRVKTTAEETLEEVALMGDHAWQSLRKYRNRSSKLAGVEAIKLVGEKKRSAIVQKRSLARAITEIVFVNERHWPLSDRKVFYRLLNIAGLLRNDSRRTRFGNSQACYDDVTDMVTRLRIDGTLPMECISDETRPVVQWDTHRSVGTFVAKEVKGLFAGYYRDLLQSQPNHVELLVEKNTIASDLRGIAAKYTIPMTSGRGYSSLPPRYSMLERFRASGREKLVIIVVSDFDPEGEDIPNSFGISLRDDFGLSEEKLELIKATLTHEQVQTLDLHEGQFAKEESSRFPQFQEKYGDRCWELESMEPETLQEIVEDTIQAVLDMDAFNRELELQEAEQDELQTYRWTVRDALSDLELGAE